MASPCHGGIQHICPASGPIVAALGRELPSCQVTLSRIDLVVQEGPERLWNWRSIAEIPFGGPGGASSDRSRAEGLGTSP
jgi:hypothetical protein